ncbi:hypothetical protein Fot_11375 [Forsythia ovata]|uniref:Uncharacterized protein n=1 Tax=Forsythia ovata TaxID=205694 RepID=A0ABD1WN79_9LAMI
MINEEIEPLVHNEHEQKGEKGDEQDCIAVDELENKNVRADDVEYNLGDPMHGPCVEPNHGIENDYNRRKRCEPRPIICVDGSHLNGQFKGTLLVAIGQDANIQIYHIA